MSSNIYDFFGQRVISSLVIRYPANFLNDPMARATYHPASAIARRERMSKVAGDKPPESLSSNPSDATRVHQIREWLPEARSNYRPK